jgi:ribosomal protein S18 acetylase RimI-like enzyme
MEEFAETQDTLIYITEHGDVVGFVLGHEMIVPENEKAFYIELFCGPGLGRKLWAEIERHAKRKGYRLLALRAASEDKKLEKELIKYYESRGFEKVTNQCSKKRLSTRKAGLDDDVFANGYWMTKCLE